MPSRLTPIALALLTLPALGQATAANAPLGTVDNPMHIGKGFGVKPPTIINSVAPNYKLTEDEKKNVGDISFGFIVDEQGVPQKIHILRCTHQDLCQAALEAVRQYRFRPATYQGHPVAVDLTISVNIDIF